jgi:prepilin-type N-terminal cleavage/methylation domain-containing protein
MIMQRMTQTSPSHKISVVDSILKGFTLVELLVVMGIISLLIGMLLPAISRARQQANAVVCQSNLRVLGQMMLIYADAHDGWLAPFDMGYDIQHVYPDPANPQKMIHDVWPTRVFNNVWNPPVLICPADLQPFQEHSYVLNSHMQYWNVKFGKGLPNHDSPSNVVLGGEKITTIDDYYMEYGDFNRVVEKYRHGLRFGSNYLMLDMHVTTQLPADAQAALDPWDFANGNSPPTTNPTK